MKIKDYKCKCGHNDFFFADKGNQKGIYCSYCGKWLKWADKDEQNLIMKQEPCNDAISRQAVLDGLKGCICEEWIKTLFATMVKQLPSVNPQESKTGHWIKKNGYSDCSECGSHIVTEWDYCPKCGARIEPRESEE